MINVFLIPLAFDPLVLPYWAAVENTANLGANRLREIDNHSCGIIVHVFELHSRKCCLHQCLGGSRWICVVTDYIYRFLTQHKGVRPASGCEGWCHDLSPGYSIHPRHRHWRRWETKNDREVMYVSGWRQVACFLTLSLSVNVSSINSGSALQPMLWATPSPIDLDTHSPGRRW